MYGSETWAAPPTVMERLDCTELLRRLLGYFWPRICHNEDLYAETDVTEVVKEDLRTLGMDRHFRRDVRFLRIWNSDEWIDSVQAPAEDREGWAELCPRTAHFGEDAGNQAMTSARRLSQGIAKLTWYENPRKDVESGLQITETSMVRSNPLVVQGSREGNLRVEQACEETSLKAPYHESDVVRESEGKARNGVVDYGVKDRRDKRNHPISRSTTIYPSPAFTADSLTTSDSWYATFNLRHFARGRVHEAEIGVYMGIFRLSKLCYYWSTEPVLAAPVVSKIMIRHRQGESNLENPLDLVMLPSSVADAAVLEPMDGHLDQDRDLYTDN
ncbi:hypothetical protein RB195_021032 [Necator americanus]|uniref:Uncharacterized protein n=1 Tax=Necator americanus TaxID=51031 RepID=A0ABR1CQ88_NECAM